MINAKNNHVVVITLARQKTSGGLILPTIAVDPQSYGRIISVGDKVKSYKEEDIIIFHINGGQVVVLENKMLRVLKEDEVYGVLIDANTLSTLEEITLGDKSEQTKVTTP